MISRNEIYCEDCITFMEKIRVNNDLKIDVIVTSPPYNIGKKYNVYKDNINENDYLEWLYRIAEKSYSILKPNGSFFLNIAERSTNPLIPFRAVTKFLCAGYKIQNTIHWIKSISVEKEDIGNTNPVHNDGFSIGHYKPIRSNRFLTNTHEYVFHFTKTGNLPIDKLSIGVPYQDKTNVKRWQSVNQDKRDRGNVWFITYPTIRRERSHPAVFPQKLARLCIKLHGCNKKDFIVYDPFMGIGNTALACIDLGIDYVGTEIDNNYIEYARKVISKKKNSHQ
ncbi:DNA-methyltransferase [Candidatus Nitrosocosmicus franklandus]|uniref:Type II methyltransferase n=1 Tax=Candidatus Nitrosocosmicus franklandianus TaxID=1798806 RepID=A0A484I5Q5_9ARCH|nr:site-specific DNA-methyltransferase [Candidatus Nitrosocosmicus franklandus]VFJ13018.1 Modification methylase MjaV [Candidatus Nitrosocosmicus franklandus]